MNTQTVTFILADGSERNVRAGFGDSVMQLAVNNRIPGIDGECGGSCACATCHVYVDDAWVERVPHLSEAENDLLDGVASERRVGSRLACQLTITEGLDGLRVEMPESQT